MHKWPQIVMILVYSLNLLIAANRHGKARTGKENFWTSLIGIVIGSTILYYGGFWWAL